MANNRRIYFASRALGIAPFQSTNYTTIHGAQSAGINVNFSLENIQELGQLNVYQLVEMVPEIEITAEKVLDGNALLYHASTQGGTDGSLVGRSNAQCMISMPVYGDTQGSASGTPQNETVASGMYIQQISYTFGADAPFREACTFVGNQVLYKTGNFDFVPTGLVNTDTPLALAGSGGVQVRQHLIFFPVLGASDPNFSKETTGALDGNGQVNAFLTILPPEIGVSSSGTNDRDVNGNFLAHIQSITCNCNLGRDTILELGRKLPYFRFATWPVQTTTEIVVTALNAENTSATELGLDGFGNNLVNRTIKVRSRDGTWVDMGTTNKLQTVSWNGGDANGGNVTATYSYLNYNYFNVTHPQDPSHIANPTAFPWPF
jgi:hypothetical protein